MYQVEVNTLLTFEDKGDAEASLAAVRAVVGKAKRSSVRFYEKRNGNMVIVPDVEKYDISLVTRGGQEVDALAGGLARKLNQTFNTSAITPQRVLDPDTRVWSVNYAGMLAQVRELPEAPEDALNVFKSVVATVLADAATRGLN